MFGAPRIASSDFLLVDVHGAPIRTKCITGSGMVAAREWMEFLDAHAATFSREQPYITFAVAAVVNVHQGVVILAKRLRKKAWWTGYPTTLEQDVVAIDADARRRLAWFEHESESIDETLLPPWARFLFAALQGAFRTLVRVADECAQIERKGHLLIPITTRGEVITEARELGEEAER